jgi:hypothetical protein
VLKAQIVGLPALELPLQILLGLILGLLTLLLLTLLVLTLLLLGVRLLGVLRVSPGVIPTATTTTATRA